jgi:hypothetical protein
MADQKIVLPPLSSSPSVPAPTNVEQPIQIQLDLGTGPTTKDMLIGGGVLLALAIVFFFIRNAYVSYLVGSKKRSPNNAGLAGWGLFGGLLFASAIGAVALISKSYLQALVIGPLATLSLMCFVLAMVIGSKK